MKLVAKVGFAMVALPAVLRASLRAWLLGRGLPLDQLTERLRQVSQFRSARLSNNPSYLAATVDRMLPLLPPYNYGPCLKRSLLLIDLWSRCGLEPRLSLGTRGDITDRNFHAWVSTASDDGPQTPANQHQEIWSG